MSNAEEKQCCKKAFADGFEAGRTQKVSSSEYLNSQSFDAGFNKGKAEGYAQGYDKGQKEKRHEGIQALEDFEKGKVVGLKEGYHSGFSIGYGESQCRRMENSYKQGLKDGHTQGIQEGRKQAIEELTDKSLLGAIKLWWNKRYEELINETLKPNP